MSDTLQSGADRFAVAEFICDVRTMAEPLAFDVEDILASDARAAIVGALKTRIKATGKTIATQFAIQMLEGSFDV